MDVAGYGSHGLCVPSVTFLQSEAPSSAALSEESHLSLPGSVMGGGGMAWEKQFRASVALFFELGLAKLSTDHLGWKLVSAFF